MSDLSRKAPEAAGVSFTPEQRAACLRGNNPVALVEIRGALDVERLRRALADVAARHDILRVAVATVSGFRDPRQWFGGPPGDVFWTMLDLSAEADPGAAASANLRSHTEAPFDVEGRALLRAVLYRLAAAQWRLALIAAPLVCDNGGLAILCRDLRDAYDGRLAPDSEDRAGYAVYADWRREVAGDADAAEGRDYWQDYLGEAATPLHLPYRHAEAASAERVEVARRAIDSELAVRLDEVATRCGRSDVAPETVLQAAWWALLARIAGSDDVLVGWRHDCRLDYAPFASTLGVFEKVLPLRLRFDAAMCFGDLLATFADTVDEHVAWQEHAAVVLPGQDGHPAIGFSVIASGEAAKDRAGEAAAWDFVLPPQPGGFEMLLLAELDEEGTPIAVAVQVDPRRYDTAAARVLLEQLFTVIAALPEACDLSIADLPFVGAAERERQLLVNAPPSEPGDGLPLGDVIALWADKTPAAPALAGADATLSYAELEAAVKRLSAWLVAQGVGAEEVVALDVTRSVGMVVALLAVWRAGGCYLPLDPQWPSARRRQLLQESVPRLVLSEDPAAVRIEGIPAYNLASVSASLDSLPVPPASAGRAEGRISDAAYVLFTSGSTGKPKGVVVDHGQLLSYVEAVTAACGLYERRRFALTSTVAADLGNTMLFGALYSGACLVVADAAEMADGASFAAFLRRQAIDCVKLTPSHLAALIDTETPALPACVILGGEPSSRRLVEQLQQISPDCRIFNHYGPTEATVGVMVHAHDPAAPASLAWTGGGLPLSRVLPGNRVYLLDPARRLVPTGAVGELCIGGRQVCRGYLAGAAMTGEVPFIDDPFHAGQSLYRTGDLARWLPDGRLQLVGRADRQVKLRGYRIEPDEVEAALAALPAVRQSAVRLWIPEGGDPQLIGFVALARGGEAGGAEADSDSAAALRAALADALPEPMVPARIVILDRLPLLSNGKVDRARLPDPADLAVARPARAPADALETLLRLYVAEVLGRSPECLGVADDFFDLGGHSLQVIRLVARLRKTLRVEVPPGIVFDHPSIAELAVALRGHAKTGVLEEASTALLAEYAGADTARNEGDAPAPLAAG